MKKLFNKIIFGISSFVLGVNNVFAEEQPTLYGPAPDYPATPDPGPSTFGIVSIVSAVVLFLVGIFVLLNKNISRKVKIIVSIVVLMILLLLFILNEFVLFII